MARECCPRDLARTTAGGIGGVCLAALLVLASCGGGSESATSGDAPAGSTPEGSASGVDESTDGISVVEDEPYRQSGDGAGSTVDIYASGDSAGVAVVLLHGFGRTGPGRPDVDLGPLAAEIAELGSAVFAFGWQSAFGFSADSVADLSCVGPFVAARAADFDADPDNVVIVGHSMGAEAGSMLAFSAFDLAPSTDCVETGPSPRPVAFLGIGGAYGMVGGPIDDGANRYRVRTFPRGTFEELDADEEASAGLTAAQLYRLDGYSALPPGQELDIVLLVGSDDQYPVTDVDITEAFAEALKAENASVEVVTVEGGDHEDVVDPATESGQATLKALAELLANTT